MITLTFLPIGGEIISGIPRFVEIDSSQPATIYYTLDGSLPSQLSDVYTGALPLPTDKNSVTLSAVGYYLDGYGNLVPTGVLSNIYATDQSDLQDPSTGGGLGSHSGRSRFLFFEGIVYAYPGGLNIPYWYDSSGVVSFSIDVEEKELDFIESTRNSDGSHRDTILDVDIIPPEETAPLWDNNFTMFDTPDSDTFNPQARYILVDGRNGTSIESTLLINGPHMELRDPKRNFNGADFYGSGETNYRSGGFSGYHYNREKEVIVFYYNDTNEGRWIKSIQKLEPVVDNSPTPYIGNPVVFKWFNWGRKQGD